MKIKLLLAGIFKKKDPLKKVIDSGHCMYWGTIDMNNPKLKDPHGCGFIDHLGNTIDVTGRSDIKKIFEL